MLDNIKKRKESGFTIVEVMIVLAIAGLVILIVFLAVPALQRNSRNTERNNDVAMIGGAINECMSNKNGQKTSCDELTATELNPYLDTSKLRQLTTLTVVASSDTVAPTSIDAAEIVFGRKCNTDGSGINTTATAPVRSVVIHFNSENTSGGLVPRCQEL